jgi:hypothetical protein
VADNSALFYWRAFSVMPNLNDKQEASLRDAVEKPDPVDEKTAKVIGQAESSLKELHRAAKCSRCVWATPLKDGVETLMPHCGKARQLARLACARAELHFQQGRPATAIDDLVATMTLGRHVAGDGVLVSILVDYGIERQAIGVAARHLGELQPAQLADFAARLDRLPVATTVRRAMQIEKECLLEGFIRDLSDASRREKLASIVKDIPGSEGADKALWEASPEQLSDAAIALRPVCDKVIAMLDQPGRALDPTQTLLAGLSKPARALGMLLFPSVEASRASEADHHTRLAMLKAALAVVGGGPEALKAASLKDLYADGPFSYEKTAGGFRLVSKHDRDGKPVTLDIGQGPSKSPR